MTNILLWSRGSRSHFVRFRLRSCKNSWIQIRQFFKFENPTPVQTPVTIDPTGDLSMFLLKKWPRWLLLLPNLKSDSGSWSGFSQVFDSGSGSERTMQNPAGVDSATQDPWPPLLWSKIRDDFERLRIITFSLFYIFKTLMLTFRNTNQVELWTQVLLILLEPSEHLPTNQDCSLERLQKRPSFVHTKDKTVSRKRKYWRTCLRYSINR